VVAEGGQNWCGTRTFEKFNKKTKIQVHLLHPLPALHTKRTEDNQEAKAYLLGREQEIPAPKEEPTNGRKTTTDRVWVQWVVDTANDKGMHSK